MLRQAILCLGGRRGRGEKVFSPFDQSGRNDWPSSPNHPSMSTPPSKEKKDKGAHARSGKGRRN